jgi:putative tricarboxylic transport membrane protein
MTGDFPPTDPHVSSGALGSSGRPGAHAPGPAGPGTPEAPGPPAGLLRGRSELLVAGGLAVLAAVVLADAATLDGGPAQRGAIGPSTVPIGVGALLAVCAVVLAVDVLRGGHGEAEAGEDVDADQPSDWRTLAVLVGAFLANVALIERAGWVISSSILFWGTAFALGSRHHVRDLGIAVALALATFYGFAIGLGLNLPAGILAGIL